jgi:ethanolamine utilization protein EutN
MRIGETIGTVTLARSHPALQGARLKLVVALELDELRSESPGQGESQVAWDELGSGLGQWVAMSDGREAAQPFMPDVKPVDCYIAALLDRVELFPE